MKEKKVAMRFLATVSALLAAAGLMLVSCPNGSDVSEGERLLEIVVYRQPYNPVFTIGSEPPNRDQLIAGLIIHAVYDNGRRAPVPRNFLEIGDGSLPILDTAAAGAFNIRVRWEGKETFFQAIVGEIPQSVVVNAVPVKRHYTIEDAFDWAGLSLTVTYGDGRTYEVEGYKLGLLFVVENHLNMAVAGPRRLTPRYMGRVAVDGEVPAAFDVFVFRSEAMRDWVYEVHSMSGGGSAEDAISVRVPPEISLEDFEMQYTGAIFDQLGGLFIALNGRFAHVDMSEAMLSTIPGSSLDAFSFRHTDNRWRNNIRSVVFPQGLQSIGTNSFRGASMSHLDLSGKAELAEIGESAFSSAGITTVDFSGAKNLGLIAQGAFAGNHIWMIDFADIEVPLRLEQWSFSSAVRYLEFPATVVTIGDYAFNDPPSLRYVRFRGPTPNVNMGWRNFMNVPQSHRSEARPAVHMLWNMSDVHGLASMHNFPIFVPATFSWTANWEGQFFAGGGRTTLQSHTTPLPYDPNTVSRFPPHIDALRGQELLDYAASGFRGQQTITIDTSTVQEQFRTGHTIRFLGRTEPLGGVITISGSPSSSELRLADHDALMEVTGLFSNAGRSLHPGNVWSGGNTGLVGFPIGSQHWIDGGSGGANANVTAANVNHRTGRYGIPIIWPDGSTFPVLTNGEPNPLPAVNMALLKIEVFDSNNQKVGYLDRWARGSYAWRNNVVEEVRVARWLYVDRDCTIHRSRMHSGTHVFLELKQGWNLIEASDRYRWNVAADMETPANLQNRLGARTAPDEEILHHVGIIVWHSAGIISEDGGRVQLSGGADERNNPIPFRQIPWVVRSTNTYAAIVDFLLTTDLTPTPPTIADPHAPRPGNILEFQNSRRHSWRMAE